MAVILSQARDAINQKEKIMDEVLQKLETLERIPILQELLSLEYHQECLNSLQVIVITKVQFIFPSFLLGH